MVNKHINYLKMKPSSEALVKTHSFLAVTKYHFEVLKSFFWFLHKWNQWLLRITLNILKASFFQKGQPLSSVFFAMNIQLKKEFTKFYLVPLCLQASLPGENTTCRFWEKFEKSRVLWKFIVAVFSLGGKTRQGKGEH